MSDAYDTVRRLLGLLNVAVLPLLVLAAVAGIRRIWLDGAPNGYISRLLTAPLWISFILSLLTAPIWIGQANVEQHGSHATALGSMATFLLAPWGFLLTYGLSLFVVWPLRLAVYGSDVFRIGGSDSGPGAASFGVAELVFAAWALVLLVLGGWFAPPAASSLVNPLPCAPA